MSELHDQGFHCADCNSDWSVGAFDAACGTCGGGALQRSCPICDGRCGAIWQRAVIDSIDRGVAHWIGQCTGNLSDGEGEAPLVAREIWLDDAAWPERLAAELLIGADGQARIRDCDGVVHVFPTRRDAGHWLSEDGYVPEAEIEPPASRVVDSVAGDER